MMYDEEIEKDCPVCNSRLSMRVSCDISIDEVECVKDERDEVEYDDFKVRPTEPYLFMIPNVQAFNKFFPVGKYKGKPFYCNGHIFFSGKPNFVFGFNKDMEEYADKDWTMDVAKWKSNARKEVEPILANNIRVILKCFDDGSLVHAYRNNVDIFYALHANDAGNEYGKSVKFMAGGPTDVIVAYYGDALIGGFTPLKVVD